MKLMKRALTMLLVLTMLLGTLVMGVSAVEPDDGSSEQSQSFKLVVYGVMPDNTLATEKVYNSSVAITEGNTLSDYFNAVISSFTIPDGYKLNGANIRTSKDGSSPKWSKTSFASEEVLYIDLEMITYTVTYKVDDVVTTETVNAAEGLILPAAPTKNGYTFVGWFDENDNQYYNFYEITSDVTLTARWEPNSNSGGSANSPVALTPAINTKLMNAVAVSCGSDHHETVFYPYTITADSNVVYDQVSGKYSVILNDSEIITILDQYNADTAGNHSFNARISPVFTIACKNGWIVSSVATMPTTCNCNHWCGSYCGGRFHKHTVTYTDGVKGSTVFTDITYYQNTNEYTKVPANPVRAGYKFIGWTPSVATKVSGCVTYTAQWAPAKGPALTTKHVAYLKGYGKGIVNPEGEITRAEAITMLYRLMDEATIKQYYTTYNAFSDVAKDAWYNDAVSTMANAGVLRYKTGLLNPNEKITRAEFFYMLTKFSNVSYTGKCTFVDVPSNYWAYNELTLAQYLGWIKGYGGGVLNPDDTITRAEVAASLNRVLGRTTCKVADIKKFSDNPTTAWYYKDIVEASIGH